MTFLKIILTAFKILALLLAYVTLLAVAALAMLTVSFGLWSLFAGRRYSKEAKFSRSNEKEDGL